jgi:hypothetical protein
MSCTVTRQRLLEYWLGELEEQDEHALEEHLFDCPDCVAESTRISALLAALRERVPPTLTEGAIARLERLGLKMRHTKIRAGERVVVPFGLEVDLLVHRLQHDLHAIDRIDCELVNAVDGAPIVAIPDVVFEPERGEVNLVCLRQYAEMFPPDAAIRLVTVETGGRRVLAEYGVMHVMPGR